MDRLSVLSVPYNPTPETDTMPMNLWERFLAKLFPPKKSFTTQWREFAKSNLRYVFDIRRVERKINAGRFNHIVSGSISHHVYLVETEARSVSAGRKAPSADTYSPNSARI